MTRKTVDCRSMPSDIHCSVTISGDEDEVLDLAVQHAVTAHGHADDAGLRAMVAGGLRDEQELLLGEGGFVQLIEFHAHDLERFHALEEEWRTAIGRDATARWGVTTADRDRAGTYVQIVAFPDHASAMRNSEHPATSEFAKGMQEVTEGETSFRNLDVRGVMRM